MKANRAWLAAVLLLACRREKTNVIKATGTLEVIEVDVAPMSPARVVAITVREGARVQIGDTLAILRQTGAVPDVDARRARLAAAEAALRDLIAGARPAELQRAEADLRAAEAEATRTARDLERMASLAASQAVSQQQLDAATSAAHTAASRRDAAAEALRLLREGARPDRVQAARAEVANARAALDAAQANVRDLTLVATVDGTVLARHAEPGEVVGAGEALVTLGQMNRPWVRVYVNERVLPDVHVGAQATGELDGFEGREFRGRVVSINDRAEFTPRVALTEDERADLMFGVKVEFEDSSGALKPGLPVTVRIPRGEAAEATRNR
jgi:membrane fusion protein YbhG